MTTSETLLLIIASSLAFVAVRWCFDRAVDLRIRHLVEDAQADDEADDAPTTDTLSLADGQVTATLMGPSGPIPVIIDQRQVRQIEHLGQLRAKLWASQIDQEISQLETSLEIRPEDRWNGQ